MSILIAITPNQNEGRRMGYENIWNTYILQVVTGEQQSSSPEFQRFESRFYLRRLLSLYMLLWFIAKLIAEQYPHYIRNDKLSVW